MPAQAQPSDDPLANSGALSAASTLYAEDPLKNSGAFSTFSALGDGEKRAANNNDDGSEESQRPASDADTNVGLAAYHEGVTQGVVGDERERRSVRRKLDLYLLPIFCVVRPLLNLSPALLISPLNPWTRPLADVRPALPREAESQLRQRLWPAEGHAPQGRPVLVARLRLSVRAPSLSLAPCADARLPPSPCATVYFSYLFFNYPAVAAGQRWPVNRVLFVSIFLVRALPFSPPSTRALTRSLRTAPSLGQWGTTVMTTAACRSFAGGMVNRFVLGGLEAGATPTMVLLTGSFWTKAEIPSRQLFWYSFQAWAGVIGGILSYAIGHIDGKLQEWEYIFLIFGALSVAWAFVVFFFLPHSPATVPYFSPKERLIAVQRVAANKNGISKDKSFKSYQAWEAARDPKVRVCRPSAAAVSMRSRLLTDPLPSPFPPRRTCCSSWRSARRFPTGSSHRSRPSSLRAWASRSSKRPCSASRPTCSRSSPSSPPAGSARASATCASSS